MAENQPTPEGTPNEGAPQSGDQGIQPIVASEWTKHIPADIANKGYWEPVKNEPLSTVLKNYGHAQERMGRSISIPDKPDDVEGWGKVYEKLGRPKEANDYKYELPSVDNFTWDKDSFGAFNKVAHEAGLSNSQVDKIVKWVADDVQQKLNKHVEDGLHNAAVTETLLKKEYGTNYDMKMAYAKRAGQMFFGNEMTDNLFDTMNEPIIRGLVKLGTQLAEDKAFGNNPVEAQGTVSKQDALRKIGEIGADRKHPYWDSRHPNHREAIAEMENLHKIAYPEE